MHLQTEVVRATILPSKPLISPTQVFVSSLNLKKAHVTLSDLERTGWKLKCFSICNWSAVDSVTIWMSHSGQYHISILYCTFCLDFPLSNDRKSSFLDVSLAGLFTGSFVTLFSAYIILAHFSGMFSATAEAGYIETVYPVLRYYYCLKQKET